MPVFLLRRAGYVALEGGDQATAAKAAPETLKLAARIGISHEASGAQ